MLVINVAQDAESTNSPRCTVANAESTGSAQVGTDPSVDVRASTQRHEAAEILKLAAYRVLNGLPSRDAEVIVRNALAHVRVAERIERGEA